MIAVRPPEYWPRPSYLAQAAAAGRLVVGDTFQYARQSFQNRARLRTPDGRQWISVPLLGGQHGRAAVDVETAADGAWRRKHWRSLEYNYRSTPFFELYEARFAPVFEAEWPRLGALTARSVEVLVEAFALDVEVVRASALPGAPATVRDVCEAVGASALLVERGRVDDAAVRDAGAACTVKTFSYETPVYRQNFDGFAPGTSALDLLFNHGPDARALLLGGGRVDEAA